MRIESSTQRIALSSAACAGPLDSVTFLTHPRGFGLPAYVGSETRFGAQAALPIPRGARFLAADSSGRRERITIAPQNRQGSHFLPADFLQAVQEQSSFLVAETHNDHLFLRTRAGGNDARFELKDEWGDPLARMGFRSTGGRGSNVVRLDFRCPDHREQTSRASLPFLMLASRSKGSGTYAGAPIPLTNDELFQETSAAASREAQGFHGSVNGSGGTSFQMPEALFAHTSFHGTVYVCCVLLDEAKRRVLFTSNPFRLFFS